jgi:hypothetical protein
LAFVRTVDVMGIRENAKHTDLSDILPEEVSSSTRKRRLKIPVLRIRDVSA